MKKKIVRISYSPALNKTKKINEFKYTIGDSTYQFKFFSWIRFQFCS